MESLPGDAVLPQLTPGGIPCYQNLSTSVLYAHAEVGSSQHLSTCIHSPVGEKRNLWVVVEMVLPVSVAGI